MVRFLHLVVDQTLSGHGDTLKEYVIGTEVFDKPATFDPRCDSIVRVEARRLRRKLQAYYRGEGCDDPVAIELQSGSYVPRFCSRTAVESTWESTRTAAAGYVTAGMHPQAAEISDNSYVSDSARYDRVGAAEELCCDAQIEFDRALADMRAGQKPTAELVDAVVAAANAVRTAQDEYLAALRECSPAAHRATEFRTRSSQ
jgi:hypothetical protein